MLIPKGNMWVTDSDSSREFHLKSDAMVYQNKLKYNAENKMHEEIRRDNRTLSELVNTWYRLHGHALKDGYPRCKKLLWLANELDNPIAVLLTTETFARYRESRSREVSTTTVNREHSYLRAVYNELRRLGVIDYENPLIHIRQFKETEKGMRFLTFDEIDSLLKMCQHTSNKSLLPVVKICLATGARWSEAVGLRASQIINNKITYLDTKSGKNRTVPISEKLFNELKDNSKSGDQLLFTGCILPYRSAIKAAKIQLPKGQSTHVLRHSFASHFIMKGGNIVVLKEILGHSTIETTMRYAHLSPDHLTDAVKLNPLENN